METLGKDFVEFWGWASGKGLMNKYTAQSLATAAKGVLSVEENWETIDLSTLNVDELLFRFRNVRKKEFTPDSLQVYERRFKQAVDLFFQYHRDPVNWKFKSKSSTTRNPKQTNRRNHRSPEAENEPFGGHSLSSVTMVEYPYPLRENCIVRMKLPVDLQKAEIERLISFLRTLVVDKNQSI